MENQNILDLVQQRTEHLVAQKLRSASIVIARLQDLIAQANRLGHSHSAIHARLLAGGLEASWNNYRSCLARGRKRTAVAKGAPATPLASPQAEPSRAARAPAGAAEGGPPTSLSSPTHVLEALAGAKQVASRDYAQVARDLRRKTRP
jgi:hypothetical protein